MTPDDLDEIRARDHAKGHSRAGITMTPAESDRRRLLKHVDTLTRQLEDRNDEYDTLLVERNQRRELCGEHSVALAAMEVRAEVAEAQRDQALRHVDELQEKLLSMPDNGKCCCSFDGPGDVCMPHSPTVNRLTTEREQARQIARHAYRNWLTPASQRRAVNSFEISTVMADALGVDALNAWLTATPPEAGTATPAIPATTDNEED